MMSARDQMFVSIKALDFIASLVGMQYYDSTIEYAQRPSKMVTQAVTRFATSSAVDSSAMTNTHDETPADSHQSPLDVAADDFRKSPSETESSDIGDGIFRQDIEKDGKQVLVVWSKSEEARVVRKADLLFLPLFSVCNTATGYVWRRCLTAHS